MLCLPFNNLDVAREHYTEIERLLSIKLYHLLSPISQPFRSRFSVFTGCDVSINGCNAVQVGSTA